MGLKRALQELSDEELTHLLVVRPELSRPAPSSFDQLAERAARWPGVIDAYRALDRFCQQLVEGLCLLPDGATVCELMTQAPGAVDLDAVSAGLRRLQATGLLWRDGQALHLVASLRRGIPRPAGLGPSFGHVHRTSSQLLEIAANIGIEVPKGKKTQPSLVASLCRALSDPSTVARLLNEAPHEARALMEDLIAAGAVGRLPAGGTLWYGGKPRTPAAWLVSRGLLVNPDWSTVEVAREVTVALRGGHPLPPFQPRPPQLMSHTVDPHAAAAACAAAASRSVEAVALLLQEWGQSPPSILKTGGLGVREVRRAAAIANTDERSAARLVQLAAEADLVRSDRDGAVVPTKAFDRWLAADPAERWLHLVTAWRTANVEISLAGGRDEREKPIPPLLLPADVNAAFRRRELLSVLREAPEAGAIDRASLVGYLCWVAPSRWGGNRLAGQLVEWVLDEAALLGVVGYGALCPAVKIDLAGRPAEAREAAAAMLPLFSTSFTLQADLTAMAAGTLDPSVAQRLAGMAEVEPRGAATTYRFTEASLRRAFDVGETAAAIEDFLAAHASKGVPQPLAYLIRDIERRYGKLRVSAISSYVRSDDPSLVAEVVRSKRTAKLNLRVLASTVAVTAVPSVTVVETLRAAGYLPAVEGLDGALILTRPSPRRAAERKRTLRPGSAVLGPAEVQHVIGGLRAGAGSGSRPWKQKAKSLEAGAAEATRGRNATSTCKLIFEVGQTAVEGEEIVALLQHAADDDRLVEIAYSNAKGDYTERVVRPLDLTPDGHLVAWCYLREDERVFTVDRIEWACLASDDDEDEGDGVVFLENGRVRRCTTAR